MTLKMRSRPLGGSMKPTIALSLAALFAATLATSQSADDRRDVAKRLEAAGSSHKQTRLFLQDGLWWPLVEEEPPAGKRRRTADPLESLAESWPPALVSDSSTRMSHHNAHNHFHHHHHNHHHQQQHNQDQHDLKTNHACEGGRMELSCQEGKQIHLVRTNYGRFSLSICNEHGFSNYSVICTSFSAFLEVQTMCNNLSNCSVPVSRDLFGDPCPGTTKYLEVQYYCNNATVDSQNTGANNGERATANSVISSAASANNPAAPPSGHRSPPSADVGGQLTPASPDNNGALPDRSQTASGDDSAGLQQTTVMQQAQQEQNFCLGQTSARGLVWNATSAGQWARQPCPEGATGRASWLCESERLRFAPALGPDFSECRSIWLARLSTQLDQILELPQAAKLSSSELIRQQDEQMIKSILGELSLMAKSKELFARDLERINIMIGQMIAQLRSLSVLFASSFPPPQVFSQPSWLRVSGSQTSNSLVSMYEELFVKLTQVISTLFDWSQRSAWLELPSNQAREALELSLLEHLKEAGLQLAQSLPSEQLNGMAAVRQANILAAISVIPASPIGDELSWSLATRTAPPVTVQQFHGSFSSLFGGSATTGLGESMGEQQQAAGELRVPAGLLAGMSANGINKFLLIDIKKADFSLLRNRLGQQASELGAAGQTNFLDLGQPLYSDLAQYQKRIFGVFPISGDIGTPVQLAPWQHKQRQELRAPVSPISVEFRMSPSLISAAGTPEDGFMQTVTSVEQAPRQCHSLDTNQRLVGQPGVWSSAGSTNHCQLTRFNSTNFLCSCWRFGFVALSQQQVLPIGLPSDQFPWPAEPNNPPEPLGPDVRTLGGSPIHSRAKQPGQQQSYGVVSSIFVVLGAALLILSVGGLAVSVALRLGSRASLNKKRQGFFDSLNGGPTTGPLATDHNLMGSDPLVSGAATTQSASIIGLSTGAVGSICGATSNYKPHHQQLYAHSPTILEAYQPPASWPLQLINWLVRKPGAWLSNSSAVEAQLSKSDHMIQHRLIANANPTLLTQNSNGTLAYHKSQYQNGYTTSLGLRQQTQQGQQAQQLQRTQINSTASARSALPLNSSSNSSYVSSSAYYEEIGGGAATTKVNPTSTIVDPFKRHTDGGQMSMLNNQHAHLQHQFQPRQQTWSQPTSNSISYSMDPQQAHQQQQAHLTMLAKQHLHTDLSPLESSSSSSAGGSTTPRHYLFASPSAVNAYKQQQQHQHQNQFAGLHQHFYDQ